MEITVAILEKLSRIWHQQKFEKLYVLGTDSFKSELENAGFTITFGEPDAVIVGFDMTLEYRRLCKAAYWIRRGKLWVSSHPDVECPTDDAMVLVDCGAITECLKTVVSREPDKILGKPTMDMLEDIIFRHRLKRDEILMVGDRINTDMQLAANAGISGILIADRVPDNFNNKAVLCAVTDLGELGGLITHCRLQ